MKLSLNKRYGIYYGVISLLFVISLFLFKNSGLSGSLGNLGEITTPKDFWIKYNIFIILLSLFFAFFFLKLKLGENQYESLGKMRKISNDSLMIFWGFSYFIFGLPNSLRPTSSLLQGFYEFYTEYIIMAFAYLVLAKLVDVIKTMRSSEEDEKNYIEIHLGKPKQQLIILVYSCIGFLVIYIVSKIFFPSNANYSGIFTKEGREFLLFMFFISVPTEEMVFRGFMYYFIFWAMRDIIGTFLRYSRKEKLTSASLRRGSSFIAILATSILFGLYHIPVYNYSVLSITYLTILGLICGILFYYIGLWSAFLVHYLNNFMASKSAMLYSTFAFNSLFSSNNLVIIIICLLSLVIIINIFKLKNYKLSKVKFIWSKKNGT